MAQERELMLTARSDGDRYMTLHTEWISGQGNGVEFNLTCGAGVGNAYIFLHLPTCGRHRHRQEST